MADLEHLQADPFWRDALVLGRQLMHVGYADSGTDASEGGRLLREMATRIPRLVGEAYLAATPERREDFLREVHGALEEVERVLAERFRSEGGAQGAVEDAFVCADALREKIGLAWRRGECLCLSA